LEIGNKPSLTAKMARLQFQSASMAAPYIAEDIAEDSFSVVDFTTLTELVTKNAAANSASMEGASSAPRQTNSSGKMGGSSRRALSFVQDIDFRSLDDIDERQTSFQPQVVINSRVPCLFDTLTND
jgi:hypothetical protein